MRPELRQTFNLSSPIFSFVLFCSLLVSTQWNVCHQAVVIIASSKMDACTLCSNHCCCYSPSQQNATQMYVMPRIDVCVYDSIRIYQLFFPSLPLARFHSSSTLNCVVWNKTYIPLLTQFLFCCCCCYSCCCVLLHPSCWLARRPCMFRLHFVRTYFILYF